MMNLQNKVVSHIDLYTDLSAGGRPAFIYAKQYDAKSRYIIATIKNGYRKIEINGAARFNAKKPDGTFFYADCQINDDSTVTVELDSQILSVDGEVSCDISIFDGDIPNRLILTTSTFFVIVEKSNYDLDAIKSSNIYVDLDDAKDKAQKAAEQAEKAADRAEAAAKRAEDATGQTEITVDPKLEIEGMAADAKAAGDRLKILEEWVAKKDYVRMTASLKFHDNGSNSKSVEYGTTVTDISLDWETSNDASYIGLYLPGSNTAIDVTNEELPYTDPTENGYKITSTKTWKITATRNGGQNESVDATASISCYYLEYWGLGIDAPDANLSADGRNAYYANFIASLSKHGQATSGKHSLGFGSVDNQYAYYAIPKTLVDTKELKFDINDDGFIDVFNQIGEFAVTKNGESVVYYLYRSENLLKTTESFTVAVGRADLWR